MQIRLLVCISSLMACYRSVHMSTTHRKHCTCKKNENENRILCSRMRRKQKILKTLSMLNVHFIAKRRRNIEILRCFVHMSVIPNASNHSNNGILRSLDDYKYYVTYVKSCHISYRLSDCFRYTMFVLPSVHPSIIVLKFPKKYFFN